MLILWGDIQLWRMYLQSMFIILLNSVVDGSVNHCWVLWELGASRYSPLSLLGNNHHHEWHFNWRQGLRQPEETSQQTVWLWTFQWPYSQMIIEVLPFSFEFFELVGNVKTLSGSQRGIVGLIQMMPTYNLGHGRQRCTCNLSLSWKPSEVESTGSSSTESCSKNILKPLYTAQIDSNGPRCLLFTRLFIQYRLLQISPSLSASGVLLCATQGGSDGWL